MGNETRFKWTMSETKGVHTDHSLKKCGGKEMKIELTDQFLCRHPPLSEQLAQRFQTTHQNGLSHSVLGYILLPMSSQQTVADDFLKQQHGLDSVEKMRKCKYKGQEEAAGREKRHTKQQRTTPSAEP